MLSWLLELPDSRGFCDAMIFAPDLDNFPDPRVSRSEGNTYFTNGRISAGTIENPEELEIAEATDLIDWSESEISAAATDIFGGSGAGALARNSMASRKIAFIRVRSAALSK